MQTITTMPFNPRHSSKFGFFSLFVCTNYFGNTNNLPIVFAINEIGSDTKNVNALQVLKDGLSTMKIQPDFLWKDVEISKNLAISTVEELEKRGILIETTDTIKKCECQKIQIRTQAKLYKTKTSLIQPDGTSLCCGSQIESIKTPILITKPFERPHVLPKIYPSWASKELDWIYENIKDQQLLLSRINDRHFSVTSEKGTKFKLDNDIVSIFLPQFLGGNSLSIKQLISGASVIRQVAIMMMLADWQGVELPEKVYFLPRVSFLPNQDVKNLSMAVEKFGHTRVYNALLWCALSGKKEIKFQGSLIKQMPKEKLSLKNDKFRKYFEVRNPDIAKKNKKS